MKLDNLMLITPCRQNMQIDEQYVVGEANTAENNVQLMQRNNTDDDLTVDRCLQMLNADQECIFTQVSEHLQHRHRHVNELCNCTHFQSLHMFISGVGGTGESFLIQTIKAQVSAIWATSDFVTCAVAALTRLAAFNVGGETSHRLFQLLTEHEGQTTGQWSLPKVSQKVM